LVFVSKFQDFHCIWDLGSSLPFQILAKCAHFEWLDQYIERIQGEFASREIELRSVVKELGSGSGTISAATVGDA
jgi:hypothetical protein